MNQLPSLPEDTVMSEPEATVRRFRMKQEGQLVAKLLRALPLTVPSPFHFYSLSLPRSKTKSGAARGTLTTIRLGPGDDAAVLSPSGKSDLVLSCDAFIEGVHFQIKTHPAH